jgi:hypothetical protein
VKGRVALRRISWQQRGSATFVAADAAGKVAGTNAPDRGINARLALASVAALA